LFLVSKTIPFRLGLVLTDTIGTRVA